MMESYEALLDRAFSKISDLAEENIDFQIPEADSIIQGSKTIIRNFAQIADVARRSKEEIETYLTRELAAHVGVEDQRLIISAKINPPALNSKIKKFFELYVICKECHKPDTRTVAITRGFATIQCEACGARYTIKYY
jgi:translation initiation factor 2 subunit 2